MDKEYKFILNDDVSATFKMSENYLSDKKQITEEAFKEIARTTLLAMLNDFLDKDKSASIMSMKIEDQKHTLIHKNFYKHKVTIVSKFVPLTDIGEE